MTTATMRPPDVDAAGAPDAPRILVAEVYPPLAAALVSLLELYGYDPVVTADGAAAFRIAMHDGVQAALIDNGLFGTSRAELTGRLRRHGTDLPVLVLSDRIETTDRITQLRAGADDFIEKPFAAAELLARLRALMRPVRRHQEALTVGPLTLSADGRALHTSCRAVRLSSTGSALLRTLMQSPEAIHRHDELLAGVWGPELRPESDAVRVCVEALELKLQALQAGYALRRKGSYGYAFHAV